MRRYLWWGPLQILGVILVSLIAYAVWDDHRSCQKIMRYADTRRDSLVATIACEKGGDAAAAASTGMAIGIGAGMAAGSR